MKSLLTFLIDKALWLFGKGINLLYLLLGLRFIHLSGRLAGRFFYFLNIRKRRVVDGEISLLFCNKVDRVKVKHITKRSFENYYKRRIETVFFGRLRKEELTRMIQAEGIENLDLALSKGKGVILLLSHFGSFLLPLSYLGYMGYQVNQITGRQRHDSLLAERIWIWRKKEADRLPVKFIQVDRFLRPVYEALRNNEIIAIAFDGRDGSDWATVDFFGEKARFSTGPFDLARRTGATVIPAFIIRKKDDTHRLVLEQQFKMFDNPDIEESIIIDTRNFAEIFADYVKRYPCHIGMILDKLKK